MRLIAILAIAWILVPLGAVLGPDQARAGTPATWHVAKAPNASDQNPGTAPRPLRTIAEALRRADTANRGGRATEIVIHPGTYRESIPLYGNQATTSAKLC